LRVKPAITTLPAGQLRSTHPNPTCLPYGAAAGGGTAAAVVASSYN